jgi:hypothetical protein
VKKTTLKPPPPNAERGSDHAPWLRLTEWELAVLRRMHKKAHDWKPSDTMIERELVALGRGMEAYRLAKEREQMLASQEKAILNRTEAALDLVQENTAPGSPTHDTGVLGQVRRRSSMGSTSLSGTSQSSSFSGDKVASMSSREAFTIYEALERQNNKYVSPYPTIHQCTYNRCKGNGPWNSIEEKRKHLQVVHGEFFHFHKNEQHGSLKSAKIGSHLSSADESSHVALQKISNGKYVLSQPNIDNTKAEHIRQTPIQGARSLHVGSPHRYKNANQPASQPQIFDTQQHSKVNYVFSKNSQPTHSNSPLQSSLPSGDDDEERRVRVERLKPLDHGGAYKRYEEAGLVRYWY